MLSNPQHKWDLLQPAPPKPVGLDYGYFINQHANGSTREELIDLIQSGAAVSFVWTPETPEPVFPEQVPFLLEAFRSNLRRNARNAIWIGAALMLFGIVLAIGFQDWRLAYRNFLSVIGAVSVIERDNFGWRVRISRIRLHRQCRSLWRSGRRTVLGLVPAKKKRAAD